MMNKIIINPIEFVEDVIEIVSLFNNSDTVPLNSKVDLLANKYDESFFDGLYQLKKEGRIFEIFNIKTRPSDQNRLTCTGEIFNYMVLDKREKEYSIAYFFDIMLSCEKGFLCFIDALQQNIESAEEHEWLMDILNIWINSLKRSTYSYRIHVEKIILENAPLIFEVELENGNTAYKKLEGIEKSYLEGKAQYKTIIIQIYELLELTLGELMEKISKEKYEELKNGDVSLRSLFHVLNKILKDDEPWAKFSSVTNLRTFVYEFQTERNTKSSAHATEARDHIYTKREIKLRIDICKMIINQLSYIYEEIEEPKL